MIGYWADFINPFSGQPYFSSLKTNTLYTTDERFRCLGFKIKDKNNCKIITYDNNVSNFVGMDIYFYQKIICLYFSTLYIKIELTSNINNVVL